MRSRRPLNYPEALCKAAAAPRKSWLGKFKPLTSVQAGWIRSLLTVWGETVGGKAHFQYRLESRDQFWEKLKTGKWSDSQLAVITEALERARSEGYRGIHAITRAKNILWPVALSELIEDSENSDDSDFIERVLLVAFDQQDPVYRVGLQFYTTRKNISIITRDLQQIAPWLTSGEARMRVRWCLEIFRAKTFLAVRRQHEKEANCD